MAATLVFLAGIGNSEEDHWQRHWHRRAPRGVWVEHDDWDAPVLGAWVGDLDRALRAVSGPKILVAHSLGCLLVPWWAAGYEDPEVAGAFLVAVPDADGPAFPEAAVGFGPTSLTSLPFPTTIVASRDDPYGPPDHARRLADAWGSRFVDVGPKGHINLTSNLGAWHEGRELFATHFGAAVSAGETGVTGA
ncbi:MAG TPA: alpha/beta hydrolase [Rubrobacter sp.]|nr:alpha/beta hydrolase [Rubrobacter sp.]